MVILKRSSKVAIALLMMFLFLFVPSMTKIASAHATLEKQPQHKTVSYQNNQIQSINI